MGNANTTPVLNDADKELKIFRQLKAEYERKANKTQDPAAIMTHMDQAYQTLVNAYSGPVVSANGAVKKVPTVRFGRTELQMPILTMGCMRFQQTWCPWNSFDLNDVDKACQENLEKIIARALELGINHIETARGYGSSELQLGHALKKFNRDEFILQTKVAPFEDVAKFRETLENSFSKLQVDRIDLFAFHGINLEKQLEWVTKPGGCMEVIKKYQEAGKVGHIGFSTHGQTPLIVKAIETSLFDYVNLHYHYVGSYTSSGSGKDSGGNLDAIVAAQKQDMGVFIISAADKGGMLYKPSKTFNNACMPEATPIAFNHLWLWNHDPPIHTLVVGAARPTDFDEAYASTLLYDQRAEISSTIAARLRAIAVEAVGEEWLNNWWKNVPNVYEHPTGTEILNMLWLWTLIKSYGMYDFARARYANIESNTAKWDDSKTAEENWKALSFNWVPGCGFREGFDYAPYVKESPFAERIPQILAEVHEWLKEESIEGMKEFRAEKGWVAAYDLQPDTPFPEKLPMGEQAKMQKERNEAGNN
mmetsp:Transcript_13604/g.17735  ORF Transcript_13604/g.17735 Transcript_13604/m.17735 type:complete len:534 (+) Transcript_13604:49-1650(+)